MENENLVELCKDKGKNNHQISFFINFFISFSSFYICFLFVSYFGSNYQSISFFPYFFNNSFTFEKWLHVKNPRRADNLQGCEDFRVTCFFSLINFAFFWASFPQSKKIILSQSVLIFFITSSVNLSQPYFLWEFTFESVVVKTLFNNKIPYEAHPVKSPWLGISKLLIF